MFQSIHNSFPQHVAKLLRLRIQNSSLDTWQKG